MSLSLSLPVLAGTISTILFATSTLPMLLKAFRTRDLRSYSPEMLLLANTGNLIHALYVFTLPPGPIWALHLFHMLSTGLMLAWYLRYEGMPAAWRRSAERLALTSPRQPQVTTGA